MDTPSSASEHMSELSATQKARVYALETLRKCQASSEVEMEKEIAALEAKYEELLRPLIEERTKVLNGEREPSAEELSGFVAPEGAEEGTGCAAGDDSVKGVPEFWLHALLNCAPVVEMGEIMETDHPCLRALKNIEVQPLDSKKSVEDGNVVTDGGFKVLFHFAPNEYFTNDVLTKEYHTREVSGQEPEVTDIKSTKIDWKEGKNLTVKLVKKGPSRRGKRHVPARVVEEPQISFFTYFDQVVFDKSDAETAELLDADFAIGSLLKERVVPHALHYYDGSAMDDEDFEFDEDEDEDGEYDDEDGEDDE